MTELKNRNRIKITEFPDYECYLLRCKNGVTPSQQSFDNFKVGLEYYTDCGSYKNDVGSIITTQNTFVAEKFFTSDSDCYVFHPNCKIPRSLISKGKVITDKSPEVPNTIVVPKNYPYGTTEYPIMEKAILLINDEAKILFIVGCYAYGGDVIGGKLHQWLAALKTTQLIEDFGNSLVGFRLLYDVAPVKLYLDLTELDRALLQRLIPEKIIIDESNLETGTEELTDDTLYSCYMMLNSPDDQIVETAFNLLARSKFKSCKNIIGWMLNEVRNKAVHYKSKSTAFRWMFNCCDKGRYGKFQPWSEERAIARRLAERITNGGIEYDDEGRLIVHNTDCIKDAHFREFVSKAKEKEI